MTCGPDTVTAQSPGSVEGSAASSDWFRYEAFLSPNSPGNFPLNHRQNHVLTFGILSLFGVGVRVLGCCVSWLSYSQALKAFQPGADTRAHWPQLVQAGSRKSHSFIRKSLTNRLLCARPCVRQPEENKMNPVGLLYPPKKNNKPKTKQKALGA